MEVKDAVNHLMKHQPENHNCRKSYLCPCFIRRLRSVLFRGICYRENNPLQRSAFFNHLNMANKLDTEVKKKPLKSLTLGDACLFQLISVSTVYFGTTRSTLKTRR